jgi:hypothetical protein
MNFMLWRAGTFKASALEGIMQGEVFSKPFNSSVDG